MAEVFGDEVDQHGEMNNLSHDQGKLDYDTRKEDA